jgi:DNA-binding transcriptional LysR family regulator
LIRPFPRVRPVTTGRAYYLVGHAETLLRPEVAAFRVWLTEEIAGSLAARLLRTA